MRLQPADARSRRCQHLPAGRLTRCFTRLGPPASSPGWTPLVLRPIQRRFLPDPPTSSACRAGGHPGCRAAVQRAVAHPLRWTRRRHPGWPPALALRQRRTSRSKLSHRLRSRQHRPPGGGPALGPRLNVAGSPGPAVSALGRGAPSGQPRRRPELTAVLRQRLMEQPGSSAPPALQRDALLQRAQLGLAQPPGRGVDGCGQLGQQPRRLGAQLRRGAGPRR